jgi:hypothetical protein
VKGVVPYFQLPSLQKTLPPQTAPRTSSGAQVTGNDNSADQEPNQ